MIFFFRLSVAGKLSYFFLHKMFTSIFPALADSIKSIEKVSGVHVCARVCTALRADLFQGTF